MVHIIVFEEAHKHFQGIAMQNLFAGVRNLTCDSLHQKPKLSHKVFG